MIVTGSGKVRVLNLVLTGNQHVTEKKEVPQKSKRQSIEFRAEPKPSEQEMILKSGIKRIRPGTKIDELLKMLKTGDGVTFEEIQEKFNWTHGGTGSYLYKYPEKFGYALTKKIRPDGKRAYKLRFPKGVKNIAYRQ